MAETTMYTDVAEKIVAGIKEEADRTRRQAAAIESRAAHRHKESDKQAGLEAKREGKDDKKDREQSGQSLHLTKNNQHWNFKAQKLREVVGMAGNMGLAEIMAAGDKKKTSLLNSMVDSAKEAASKTSSSVSDEMHKAIEQHGDIKNFWNSLKTDASLMLGKLGMLTQIPGMVTLLSGMKFLLATIGALILKILGIQKKSVAEDATEAPKKKLKQWGVDGQPDAPPGKKKGQIMSKAEINANKSFMEKIKDTKMFSWMKDKKWMAGITGPFRAFKRVFVKTWTSKWNLITGGTKIFKGTMFQFQLSLWGLTKALFKAALGIVKVTVKFAFAIAKFVISTTLLIASIIAGALGFLAVPIAIAILVIMLVALGIWLYRQKDVIAEKWEIFKQKFMEGWEALMEFGDKIKDWFTDAGMELWLGIKTLWVAVMEGLQSAVNWAIDQFNFVLPERWQIPKATFAEGMAGELESEKEAFKIAKADKGGQIEDGTTAVKNAGWVGGVPPVNPRIANNVANVTNLQQSRTYVATGTGSSDAYARAAGANA